MAKYGDPNRTWDYSAVEEPYAYGGDDAYREGMAFLDHKGWTVEDWGCGTGYAKRFLKESDYVGIDFSPSDFCDKVEDLTEYESKTEAIFMRGVLEHNPKWRTILKNAVKSFTERFALVTFVPLEQEDRVIDAAWPTLAISEPDLTEILSGLQVERKDLQTVSEFGTESVFLCSHKPAPKPKPKPKPRTAKKG